MIDLLRDHGRRLCKPGVAALRRREGLEVAAFLVAHHTRRASRTLRAAPAKAPRPARRSPSPNGAARAPAANSKWGASFDHPVGAEKHALWNNDPEFARSCQVHGNIARPGQVVQESRDFRRPTDVVTGEYERYEISAAF
jgi:hypothetical protein